MAVGKQDLASVFAAATTADRVETRTLRPIVGDKRFAASVLQFVRDLWTGGDWIGLLEVLKDSRDHLQHQSLEVRRCLNLDERLQEIKDILFRVQAFAAAEVHIAEELGAIEQELRLLEIAVQFSYKSLTSELRKDPEAQRRLAYFLGVDSWADVLVKMDEIEHGTLKVLDGFLSNAEHRVQMPVSQTGSLGSSPFA